MKKNRFFKHPPKQFALASILSLAFASCVLAGCGSGMLSKSSSSYIAETAAASYDMAADTVSAAGMPASFSKSASANALTANEYENPEAASADSGSTELSQDALLSEDASRNAAAPIERKLIRNINMNLETRDFDGLIKSISEEVASFGGYIEQSDVSGNSLSWSGERSSRYSNITARIPSDKLDAFLTEVSSRGNVTYKNESVQDVTLQYTDITSRKKTLQLEQERLWDLLEKADSVDAVIALESRLSEVRYQLESLESQLRTLDNQIVYSTVYLSIQEVQVLTSTDPDTIPVRIQKGLSRSLNQLQAFSINLLVWFITSLPILIVLAVLIFVVVIILRKVNQKRNGDSHKPKAANEAPSASSDSKQEQK